MEKHRSGVGTGHRYVVGAILIFVAIVVACDARLSGPREPESPSASVTTVGTQPIGSRGSKHRDKAYTASVLKEKPELDAVNTCFTATARDSTIRNGHVFDTVRVGRAGDTIAAPEGTTRYTFIRWKRPSRHVTLMATCVIPKGDAARAATQAHFRAQARKNEGEVSSAQADENELENQFVEDVEYAVPQGDELANESAGGDAGAAHRAPASPLASGLEYMECELLPGYLSCNDFMCDYDWVWERWDCDNDCYGYWVWDDWELEFYIWLECGEQLEWSGGPGTSGQPPPSDFVLECNSSAGPITVERAQTVTCEATTTPNGTISSLEWYFDGNRFEVTGDSIGTENPLSGPMLDSGVLSVSGEINYIPAGSADVQIRVTPRTWTWAGRATYDATRAAPDCYTLPWTSSVSWGWMIGMDTLGNGPGCVVGNLFTPDYRDSTSNRGFPITRVTSGPNTGLWRVSEFTTGLRLRSGILRSFRADGERYEVSELDTLPIRTGCNGFGLPVQLPLDTVNINCMNFTGTHQYRGMVDSLRRHERCHALVAIDTFNVMPNVAAEMERVVQADSAAAFALALQLVDEAHHRIWQGTRSLDDSTTGAFSFWGRLSPPVLTKWQLVSLGVTNWSVRAGC